MTDNCPFDDEERAWLERRMRELIAESERETEASGPSIGIGDVTVEDETSPPDCPECGGPQYLELGRKEPRCPSCD